MVPNTALALTLAALGMILRKERRGPWRGSRTTGAILCGFLVLSIGAITLMEYAFDVEHGLDELLTLVPDFPLHPGRASPLAAASLVFLGAALIWFDTRSARWRMRYAEWLAGASGFMAMLALIGHLFGTHVFYRLGSGVVLGVALSTAVVVLLLVASVFLESANDGFLRHIVGTDPAAVLFRRLGLLSILVPIGFGLMVNLLHKHLSLELPLTLSLLVISMIPGSLTVTWFLTAAIGRLHAAVESNRARMQALFDQASEGIFVADSSGRYVEVNRAGADLLGYTPEELIGKTALDLVFADDAARISERIKDLRHGHTYSDEWRVLHKDGTPIWVEVNTKLLADGRQQSFLHDIRERKRAEDERQVFVSLLENSSDFIGIADPNGKPIYVNPAGRRMVGLGADQPVEQTKIPEYYPPEERAFVDNVITKSMIERGRWSGETYFRNWKTGEAIPVSDESFLIHGADGRVLGIGTITRDISEARRTAHEREEVLAQFRNLNSFLDAIIENIPFMVFVKESESLRFVRLNRAGQELLGWPSETFIGKNDYDFWPNEQADSFVAKDRETLKSGKLVDIGEEAVQTRDRGVRILHTKKVPILDAAGKPLYLLGISEDITERTRIEKEQRFLAELGAVLSNTLEHQETVTTIARLLVRDLADWCFVDIVEADGRVRHADLASADSTKSEIAEGLKAFPLNPDLPHLMWEILKSRQPQIISEISPRTLEAISQSPEHRRLLDAASMQSAIGLPLIAHGRVIGGLILASSLPERRLGPADLPFLQAVAERAALALDNARLYGEVKRAVQDRDGVLGIVAHDLRNPLNVIQMQAQLLHRRGVEPERRSPRPGDTIVRAATRMDRLIQDILDVTRMEAGRLSVKQARVPSGLVVAESVESQKPLVSAASLDLRLEVADDLPDVWADRDRLLQVFENLIGNAVKFARPSNQVTAGAALRDAEVLFWVADTGPGVAPAELPHLFDRFWQAQKTGRRGAGLGLSIVKGIVEAHGGRIWAESTMGVGTTFYFTIPIAPTAGAEPARAEMH